MRLPLIVTTPRSGSTWLYGLLLARLRLDHGERVRGLVEPLNVTVFDLREDADRGLRAEQRVPWSRRRIDSEDYLRQVRARAELLVARASPASGEPGYFYKVFAGNLPEATFAELHARHDCLYLERRDLWEQYLSFPLALTTGRWNSEEPGAAAPREVVALREDAELFAAHLLNYQLLRRRFSEGRVLVYEDCVRAGAEVTLATAGYPLPAGTEFAPRLPTRLAPIDKLACFANGAEIRAWYRELGLPGRALP